MSLQKSGIAFLVLFLSLSGDAVHSTTTNKPSKPTVSAPVKPTKPSTPTTIKPNATPTPTKQIKLRGGIEIEDTHHFFVGFLNVHKASGRGEFETEGEYKKRQPKPFDSKKILYFPVSICSSDKNYRYDVSSQKLTMIGGVVTFLKDEDKEVRDAMRQSAAMVGEDTGKWVVMTEIERLGNGTPVLIRLETFQRGQHEAMNAFGAKVNVKTVFTQSFILYLLNLSECPQSVAGDSTSVFRVDISLPPKDAEKLSKSLEMVLGVTLPGYDTAAWNSPTMTEATLDSPVEVYPQEYIIGAMLVKVLLQDRVTGKVWYQCDVPPKKVGAEGIR